MNVLLPEDLARLVDEQLAAGRFATATDVIGEGLRLLRRQEELRAEIAVGIAEADRGEVAPFHAADILAELRGRRAQ